MKTVIKYANRKLYDKESSKYITVKELLALPLGTFQVVTHNDSVDITTETLLNALSSDTIERDVKVKVMQHCILQLSN